MQTMNELLLRAAQLDPTINACLVAYGHGRLEWEEALIMTILQLTEEKQFLLKTLLRIRQLDTKTPLEV